MLVIDLFSGVGGLSLGFSQAGFKIIYANEYNKEIADAYKLNHIDTEVDTTDILNIDFEKKFKPFQNKVNIVIGGPPCQGFSQKGKRIGISDERNFMFRQFIKAVEIIKPDCFVMENVSNILTAENGYFRDEIISSFERIGYKTESNILKTEKFGVPQTRRRAFFLGAKGRLNFHLPNGNGLKTTVIEAISDLPILISGEGYDTQNYTSEPLNAYQQLMRKNSSVVKNHFSTKHSDTVLERLSLISIGSKKESLPSHHRTKSIHSGTWMRLNPDGFSPTITTRFDTPSSGQFTLPYQDRCLTIREAARLQSFPDDFIFSGNKSTQMLQVGNAVPPLVAFEIAKVIKKNFMK
jgi:DNA (cytosine-5)-methyltransferase 1